MGMDVYGINPTFPSKAMENAKQKAEVNVFRVQQKNEGQSFPDWPESDKEEYFAEKQKVRDNSPGEYFRASIWSWRPIHGLISMVITKNKLPWKYWLWGDNSGAGIGGKEQRESILQDIEERDDLTIGEKKKWMQEVKERDFVENPDAACKQLAAFIEDEIKNYVGEIYLNTGMWVDGKGRFLSPEQLERYKKIIKDMDNKLLLPGPITPSYAIESAKTTNIEAIYPAHSTTVDHIKEFCMFLRHCGGFEIC